jgi:hypothetical protein
VPVSLGAQLLLLLLARLRRCLLLLPRGEGSLGFLRYEQPIAMRGHGGQYCCRLLPKPAAAAISGSTAGG